MTRRIADIVGAGVVAAILLAVLLPQMLAAAPVTVPHTFSDGQRLPAAYLNDNSAALAAGINSITVDQLTSGAVTAPKIAAGAVGTTQLADNGVTSAKVLDGGLVGADLATGTVGTTQLANLGVTAAKLAVNASRFNFGTGTVTTGMTITTTDQVLATVGPVTTRGGTVLLLPSINLQARGSGFGAPSGTVTIRWMRDIVNEVRRTDLTVVGGAGEFIPVAVPIGTDAPTAAPHTYTLVVHTSAASLEMHTEGANAGNFAVLELS